MGYPCFGVLLFVGKDKSRTKKICECFLTECEGVWERVTVLLIPFWNMPVGNVAADAARSALSPTYAWIASRPDYLTEFNTRVLQGIMSGVSRCDNGKILVC